MANGLFDKLTNFLMPLEETVKTEIAVVQERKAHLKLQQAVGVFKVFLASPTTFDDVRILADYLKTNTAVIINFENTDMAVQQRINDFLNGLCHITGGSNERISENAMLYVPSGVDIGKELYAFAPPTYVKQKIEL